MITPANRAIELKSPFQGEGAGDPTKRKVKLRTPNKTTEKPTEPPTRSQSVNGQDVSQTGYYADQFNKIFVEDVPTQGVNEKANEIKPNLNISGVGQNLYPTVQDNTRQNIGTPINPKDPQAGEVQGSILDTPAGKMLMDNLFMTGATKESTGQIMQGLGEMTNGESSKGFQRTILGGLGLTGAPFTALDQNAQNIPDIGQFVSGVSSLPFMLMGEAGKISNEKVRNFLGIKLADKEQEQLADEIAGVLAQFVIPMGIEGGVKRFGIKPEKLIEIKTKIDAIPQEIKTPENIKTVVQGLLPEGSKFKNTVDPQGNVTREKIPTGDFTSSPVDKITESKKNIESNPLFPEPLPKVDNYAGINDLGATENVNLTKGLKSNEPSKKQLFKDQIEPELKRLAEINPDAEKFMMAVQRQYPKNYEQIGNYLQDFGYTVDKGTTALKQAHDLFKSKEQINPKEEYIKNLPEPTAEEKTRAKDFVDLKREANLNLNSVGDLKLDKFEIRKGLNDIKKEVFDTKEAKLVLDKINKAYEQGISGNNDRGDFRKPNFMSADELKGLTDKPKIPKELTDTDLKKQVKEYEDRLSKIEDNNVKNFGKKKPDKMPDKEFGRYLDLQGEMINRGLDKPVSDFPTLSEYMKQVEKNVNPVDTKGKAYNDIWKKEHKKLVEARLKKGKPVSDEVLKDYPELKKKRIISEDNYKKAKDDLNKPSDRLSSNPVDFYAKHSKNLATVGLYHFENGFRDFTTWSKELIREFGDKVKPHLKAIWDNVKGENDLIARHNLSSSKLVFADRMGGIANPSIAITKRGLPFESFGDVTLVADKNLINPKTKNAKVFGADAYTPRYPRIDVKFNYTKAAEWNKKISDSFVEIYPEEYPSWKSKESSLHNYIKEFDVNGLQNEQTARVYFLKEIAKEKLPKEYDRTAIDNLIKKHEGQFENWVENSLENLSEKKRFFKGFSYSGNRMYEDFTLENISKELNKQIRSGEGFNYGLGTLRSGLTPELKSIDAIAKIKEKLVTEEKFEEIKKEYEAKFDEVLDEAYQNYKYDSGHAGDQFIEGVLEALQKKRSITRILEEYGFNTEEMNMSKVFDFLGTLKTMPTEYFEAKMKRPVKLNEFKTAIVPKDVSQRVLDVLNQNGIKDVRIYDKAITGDRLNKVNEITEHSFGAKSVDYIKYGKAKDTIKEALTSKSLDMSGLSKLVDLTDKKVLKATFEIAKYHFENGLNKFGDWARQIIKDTGAWIKPHLKELWKYANGEKSIMGTGLSLNVPPPKDRKISKVDPEVIPMGSKESQFEYNKNTVHGDIEKEVRKYVSDNLDYFKEIRRGRITDEQLIKQATKIATGLTKDKAFDMLRTGATLSAEKHLAVVGFTSKLIKDLIKDKSATSIDKSEAFKLYAKSEAVSAELGRALRSRQLVPKLTLDEMKSLVKDVPEELKPDIQKILDEVSKDPEAVNNPKLMDKIRYYIYNAMLSRPLTHARNIIGNTSHLLYEALLTGDLPSTLRGLKRGGSKIPTTLKRILNEGGEASKFIEGKQYEPENKYLRNSMPTTWLKIEDVVFKELSKGIETEIQGKQISKELKVSPDIVIKGIENVMKGETLKNPVINDRLIKAIDEINGFAEYVTFQKELGTAGKKFQGMINAIPGGFLVVPFIRTPANILKVGLQPLKVLKFASKEYRAEFRDMTPTMKRKELTRMTAGAMTMGLLAYLTANGTIDVTGQGADDKSKKDFMEKQGWKPNSVKIGDKYISYQNTNPFNVFLGILGNYSDGLKYNYRPKDDELNIIQKMSKTTAGFVQTVTDQSFLQGLSNLAKWQETKDPYYFEQFLQMPVPGVLSAYKDLKGDNTAYEQKTFGDKLSNRLGTTDGLKPRINVFGEPEKTSGTGLPIPTQETPDALSKLLLDNNVTISYPKKDIIKSDGQKVTDDEYYNFVKESGQRIKKKLDDNFETIKGLTAGDMNDLIDNEVRKIRDDVKEEMFGKKEKQKTNKIKLK